ncbi:hypothetical protein [Thalassovita mangrovi]|uniref:Uncharacterized protein n=1 Tax=Thalassovita mangrovi TaxID=2692236 RepID=A0A6L8LJF4_9RHOB|nr:hypothetical protein [Thalassovita mangrovi]MYM56201.1 hypothetical protein [Thalassovita mangrovi]
MKKHLGKLVGLLLFTAVFIFARLTMDKIFNEFSSPSSSFSEADAEKVIEGTPTSAAMYHALQEYYPDEAGYFRSQFVETIKTSRNQESANADGFKIGAEIRRRHAPHLRKAPDKSLQEVLQLQTQIIAMFEDDTAMCNRVIMFGAGSIPKDKRQRIEGVLDSTGVIFRAMHEGEYSPVQREPVTENDWRQVIAEFSTAGGTETELALVMEPDVENAQLCNAMLRFLRVLTDADFPGADRPRAEIAAAMLES